MNYKYHMISQLDSKLSPLFGIKKVSLYLTMSQLTISLII